MKSTAPTNARRWYRWAAALLATAAGAGLAFFLVDLGSSAAILAASDPWLWIAVVALSLFMGMLRALRITSLVRPVHAWPVIKASLLHTAANAVLPAKTGEAALPLALSRYAGLDIVHGIGLLLIVRLCDMAAMVGLGLFVLGALDPWDLPPEYRFAIAAIGALIAGSVYALPYLARIGGAWANRTVSTWGLRMTEAAILIGRNSGTGLVASTFSIWLALLLAAQVSLAAVGLQVEPALVALASVAASIAFALPVSGIANAGPVEAAFAGVLVAGGVPAEGALAAAVLLHVCSLGGAILAAATVLVFPVSNREVARCT